MKNYYYPARFFALLWIVILFVVSQCRKDEVIYDNIILISPDDSSAVREDGLKFMWYGPDRNEYQVFLGKDSVMTQIGSSIKPEFMIPELEYGQHYTWQIKTLGTLGNTLESDIRPFSYMTGEAKSCYPGFTVPQRFGFVGDTIKFIHCPPFDDPFDHPVYTMDWDYNGDEVYEVEGADYEDALIVFDAVGFYKPRVHLGDENGQVLQYTFAVTITKRPESPIGYLLDQRDDQLYRTVEIGNQTWMAHNLNYAFYSNDSINAIASSFSVKGGEGFYGMHYAGMAAQNSCPKGWHLPSDEEWMELERYLGMSEEDIHKISMPRGPGIDDLLKASFDWSDPDQPGNSSGFGALPAGYWVYERSYNWISYHQYTAFWCWNEADDIQPLGRSLHHDKDGVSRFIPLSTSFSARCLKDK